MKRRRLSKIGKIVATILLLTFSILIYSTTGRVGELAQDSEMWLAICCAEWFYLFFVQVIIGAMIWEN